MGSKVGQDIIYDRQIRLWGVEAQSRLENSRVVIGGSLSTFASEVAKNLALAGVGAITIVTEARVTLDDVHQNFLVDQSHLGNSLADAIAESTSEFNPFIKINSIPKALEDIPDTEPLWDTTDLLILLESNTSEILRKNELTRKRGIYFLVAHQFATHSWIFIDVCQYTYANSSQSNSEKEASLQTVSSPSFSEAIFGACKFRNKSKKEIKRLKTMPFLFSLAHLRAQIKNEDIEFHFKTLCKEYDVEFSENINSYLEGNEKLQYVAAYMGGLLAQEATKILQHNHSPLLNFIVYSTSDIPCYVYELGPTMNYITKEDQCEPCDVG